jgi:hypothetical protein
MNAKVVKTPWLLALGNKVSMKYQMIREKDYVILWPETWSLVVPRSHIKILIFKPGYPQLDLQLIK